MENIITEPGNIFGLMFTSGSRTSETGGQNFCRNFLTTIFRRFPTKFQHFPKKCHLSPKISDDHFFRHRPFPCFNVVFSVGGAKSVADIDSGGGQNPYISTNSRCYHYSLCPRRGPNSVANFDGGAMAEFAPWICHWIGLS